MNNWDNYKYAFEDTFEHHIHPKDAWSQYAMIHDSFFTNIDNIISNETNEVEIKTYSSILQQKDRIPLANIYNAINVVKQFYQGNNMIQILSCIFDEEEVNIMDIELQKGDLRLKVSVTLEEDSQNSMTYEAYLLHNGKLNYGTLPNMINYIKSL